MYRGRRDPRSAGRALGAAALLLAAAPVAAVLIAAPPGRNLAPPSERDAGPEAGGWSFVGDWGAFTGIAVSPHHFLTARHVGGRIGRVFQFHGHNYRAVGRYPIGDTDMTLWQVEGNLPLWAELYRGDDTQGHAYVVGRGMAPDAPIRIGDRVVGWRWGQQDRRRSWGRTRILRVTRESDGAQMLASPFTPDGCSLATGDSGGGVFLKEDGRWRLAGVCHAVENPWSASPDGSGAFTAALLDARGLYRPAGGSQWGLVTSPSPVPTVWYASRIAPDRARIQAILDAPPGPNWWRIRLGLAGAGLAAAGVLGAALWRRRLRRRSA